MAVIVTETAAREIAAIIKQQDLDAEKIRLRVGVKGGGCSGFSYLLDLTESRRDTDEEWEFTYEASGEPIGDAAGEAAASEGAAGEGVAGEGVAGQGEVAGDIGSSSANGSSFTIKVVCDPKSYLYLNGTTIDFKDELMGRGFVFENPNATATCGCGSSFSA